MIVRRAHIAPAPGVPGPGAARPLSPMGVPGWAGGPAALPARLRALRDAQDCSQDGPRCPQEAPKTCQEGSKTPKMAPRRPKWAPKTPQEPLRCRPRAAREAKIVDFHLFFRCFLLSRCFGFPTLQDCPRGSQDHSKTAQEAPKRAPRLPPDPPKTAQESPKKAPGALRQPSRRPQTVSRRSQDRLQVSPAAHDAFLTAQEASHDAPRGLNMPPKSGPRGQNR